MSGIRMSVRDGDREPAHVQTETVDDFHYFRDSVHAVLERGGGFATNATPVYAPVVPTFVGS